MADRVSKLRESRRAPSAAGMVNNTGQYNCFLNVVVQSLWHLKSFQDAFVDFPDHAHVSDKSNCVLCALYFIFQEYREATGSKLDSINLRQALSEAFAAQQKFQEGVMADAGECYIELLQLISNLLPTDALKDKIVHSLFDTVTADRIVCSACHEAKEQPKITSNTSLLYVTKLLEVAVALGEKPFDVLIGAILQQDTLACPKCTQQACVTRRFQALPAVYTLSLVWPSSRPRRTFLNDFFNAVSMQIDLRSICALDLKDANAKTSNYNFRGMILYYGRHYTAVFYHSSMQRWLRFDDTRVDPIGRYWHEVTDWCVQSRFQPSMLFYERETPDQDYYEPVPQDVIPRPLPETPKMDAPDETKIELVCPRLEGPVYRKSKKQWILQWAKLHEWTLGFFEKPQQAYVPHLGRYEVCRRDPPVLEIPVASIQLVEQDRTSHNFSRKPFYINIVATNDMAAPITAGESATASSQVAGSIPLEYTLFVENEGPYARWISALSAASDILKRAQKQQEENERSAKRDGEQTSNGDAPPRRKKIVDNEDYFNRDTPTPSDYQSTPSSSSSTANTTSLASAVGVNGAPPHLPYFSNGTEGSSALAFAPNASLEDLRRIAEMESQTTPRNNGEARSAEEQNATILHGNATAAHPEQPHEMQQPVQPLQFQPLQQFLQPLELQPLKLEPLDLQPMSPGQTNPFS